MICLRTRWHYHPSQWACPTVEYLPRRYLNKYNWRWNTVTWSYPLVQTPLYSMVGTLWLSISSSTAQERKLGDASTEEYGAWGFHKGPGKNHLNTCAKTPDNSYIGKRPANDDVSGNPGSISQDTVEATGPNWKPTHNDTERKYEPSHSLTKEVVASKAIEPVLIGSLKTDKKNFYVTP